MKFLSKNNFFKITKINYHENTIVDCYKKINPEHVLLELIYTKKYIKNRKILLKIKKGVTNTEKRNSLKRDKNNTILQQYINIMVKNGNKNSIISNFNKALENFFFVLNNENEEFYKYKNYLIINYLVNNFVDYNDINFILESFLPDYYSIFDMKTIKPKKKPKNKNKYSHQITYIPENKRLKNFLKILNIYSNGFKNYSLWERLFWVLILLITDKDKTNLIKRRSFIYKKSIKFFRNSKN